MGMARKLSIALATAFVLLLIYLTVAALAPHADPILSERTDANMTMQAAPPSVKAGETIRLSLTVTGPAEYSTCRPVRFWADAAGGKRAWTEVQFWACTTNTQPGTVPAGEKMTFSRDWRTTGMAPGRYTVRGAFGLGEAPAAGNIPTVTVEIRI
jgi:hypothetical protein